MSTDRISVALCTHNGAAFLREQLASIESQTLLPSEIVISDDCSVDGTKKIVSAFAARSRIPVRYYANEERIGVVRNFDMAVRGCLEPYIALCDQDDVWLSDKLAWEMSLLHKAERGLGKHVPLLVHSDLTVVDSRLVLLHGSLRRYQKLHHADRRPLGSLLVQNFVTGCTVLMNRPLVEIALPFPQSALMHDWWLALCAAVCGEIRTLPVSTVLYRQHGHNKVGAESFWQIAIEKISRYLVKYQSEDWRSANEFYAKIRQAVALREHFGEIAGHHVRLEVL
ncbi:MAG: glycosyltransferase family 2 protein, partial [Leptospirales bacterium]